MNAARKSMDDVLKRLTSKMSHSTLDDAEQGKRERERWVANFFLRKYVAGSSKVFNTWLFLQRVR